MYDDYNEGNWTAGFRSKRTWIRGFFMLLFLFILWFARLLLIVMTVFQFGAQLIIRRPVSRGLPLGRSLATYLQQIAMFLTYNTEDKPFPFAPWPDPGASQAAYGEDDGEEGEAYEAYEPDEPADAPFAPEPEAPAPPAAAEPEPEPEEEPTAKPAAKSKPKSAARGGKKKKAAKSADDGEEAAEDAAGSGEAADPDDESGEPPPPRPDA